MEYTSKQLIKILSIKDFLGMTNTLSKIYRSYDDKKVSVENDIDKNNIYKILCSTLFNTIDGIIKCKEFFNDSKKIQELNNLLNQTYITENKEIYNRAGYKTTLYKILREIRNLYNHFEKEENDETILYEVYVDFSILEKLRVLINDIYYEFYKEIDKRSLKKVELNRKKIKYSMGLINNSITSIEKKFMTSNNRIDKMYSQETSESINLVKKTFEASNLYDLFYGDSKAIEEFNMTDSKISKYYEKAKKEIEKNGSSKEKQAMKIIEKIVKSNENVIYIEREDNFKKIYEDIEKLVSDTKEDK